jgi:hypothetical protein
MRRRGYWLILCGSLLTAVATPSDTNTVSDAPIRRLVVYKDGHCFTQREIVVNSPTAAISELPHALLGGVWAYSRDPKVQVAQLRASWHEAKRTIAPQNMAELLVLNDGAEVTMELMFPAPQSDSNQPIQTEQHSGKLRVFKPAISYKDAYPTHDPPPPYSPQPISTPRPRRDWYYGYYSWYPYGQQSPPDYVQDDWSRMASQCSFALETARGMVAFTPAQVKRVEFLGNYVKQREATLRHPQLEIHLNGAKTGQRTTVVLAALERGIRWIPEYRLVLPQDTGEATLELHATLINELSDLRDAEVTLAVGAPQFLMKDEISPLAMRETFMQLSRWFGEPEDVYQRAIGGAGGFGGFGGFGGAVPSAPSAPGMGISPASSEPSFEALTQSESQATVLPHLSLMPLGRITLPKDSIAQHAVMQQPLPYKRVCFWAIDLTQRERESYYWYRRDPRRFRTFEELAYELMQRRNLSGEVQDAILLENKGNLAWTTAPITVVQNGAPIAQDILLFTPQGGDALVVLGPAPQVSLSHTVSSEEIRERGVGRTAIERRGIIHVTNARPEAVLLVVRVRFLGHYLSATREPFRITRKSVEQSTSDTWDWSLRQKAPRNPFTEVTWEVIVPPGATEWEYRYEIKEGQ